MTFVLPQLSHWNPFTDEALEMFTTFYFRPVTTLSVLLHSEDPSLFGRRWCSATEVDPPRPLGAPYIRHLELKSLGEKLQRLRPRMDAGTDASLA